MSSHSSDLEHIPPRDFRYTIAWVISCNSWIVMLVLVYCLYVFNKIRGLVIYQKRYPFIVRLECCIAICLCAFIWPIWAMLVADYEHFILHNNPLQIALFIFYPFLGHAIVMLEFCRLWTMYFRINYMNAVSHEQWISIVDNSYMITNWYILNNQTYGNITWVAKRVFLYYVFAATTSTSVITVFGFTKQTQIIDNCLYAIPVFGILYLYWTLVRRKALITDNFFFYLEFKTTSILWGVSLFIYLGNQILFLINAYYACLLTKIICTYALSGISIVSALYIPRTILANYAWIDPTQSLTEISTSSGTSGVPRVQKLEIEKIFTTQIYAEYFIQHMIKEFSLESAVSWIEMNQFQSCLYHKLLAIDPKLVENAEVPRGMCDSIPKSTIVFKNSDDVDGGNKDKVIEDFKSKYVDLFKKYIETSSEYQVNISFHLGNKYARITSLCEEDKWEITPADLVDVFDPVVRQMDLFMTASLLRFCKSSDFKKIYKE